MFRLLIIVPLFELRHGSYSLITHSFGSAGRSSYHTIVKQCMVSSTLFPICFRLLLPDMSFASGARTGHARVLLSSQVRGVHHSLVHAPLVQMVDMQLAVAGFAATPPMCSLIKDIHEDLTADSSSQQLLEFGKPRMGAHLLWCERSGMSVAIATYSCMHQRLPSPPVPACSDTPAFPRSPRYALLAGHHKADRAVKAPPSQDLANGTLTLVPCWSGLGCTWHWTRALLAGYRTLSGPSTDQGQVRGSHLSGLPAALHAVSRQLGCMLIELRPCCGC